MEDGRNPTGRATRASPQAPTGLDHPASIPCAADLDWSQFVGSIPCAATISEEAASMLSDADLVEAVSDNVWNAAHYRRYGPHDANCSLLYREAVRRGNEGLYDTGYKRALRSAGH